MHNAVGKTDAQNHDGELQRWATVEVEMFYRLNGYSVIYIQGKEKLESEWAQRSFDVGSKVVCHPSASVFVVSTNWLMRNYSAYTR